MTVCPHECVSYGIVIGVSESVRAGHLQELRGYALLETLADAGFAVGRTFCQVSADGEVLLESLLREWQELHASIEKLG